MVLFYKTNKYEGKLSSSNEGEVYWMEIDDMKKANLADGMEKMLEVFLKENLSEYFFYKENNKWVDVLK
jgi:8-oxo-dGTP diphosphatase